MLATLILKPYYKDMLCTMRLLKWYGKASEVKTMAVLDRYFHFSRSHIYPKSNYCEQ